MNNHLDHIAVGAESLEQGERWVNDVLGVSIPRGGKHAAMSTHNCLAQTGNDSFLEVIAIDRDAPDPGRIRWFSLDDHATRNRLTERPHALCWVVNTDDLDAVIAASPVDLGEVLELSRGELSWRLTVPKDGSLAEGGLIPTFIEWPPGPHPSNNMQDIGLVMQQITLHHPDPDKIGTMLTALSIEHLAVVEQAESPALSFSVKTPAGDIVVLD